MSVCIKYFRENKTVYVYVAAAAFLLLSAFFGLLAGATQTPFFGMMEAVFSGDLESAGARIFLYVRLPRVLGGFVCGAALAASGAIIQGVLANRLASPSIIGVNSGAALAVTLCSAAGVVGGFGVSLFAFIGAFVTVMAVSLGAKRWGASRGTVILLGVAINAFLGAIADLVTTFSPEISVMSNDFKIGDLSAVTYQKLIPAAALVLVALAFSFTLSNELDVLTLGDENARGLGLNVGAIRVIFLIIAAALAGAAVSFAGLVAFVGLLVPHAVRRLGFSSSKHLLPLSAMLGAGFLTLCDTLARTVFAPFELPVGIIMAFLGAPFFVFILIKGKGGHGRA